MRERLGSVRVRLTLAVTVLFALALVGAAFVLVRTVNDRLVAGVQADDLQTLETLRADLEAQGELPEVLPRGRRPGVIQAIRENGEILATSGEDDAQSAPPPRRRPPAERVEPTADQRTEGDLAVSSLAATTPEGVVSLIATTSLTDVQRSVDTLENSLWLALPVVVAVTAAMAWFVTGRALRPVESITRRVEEISASSLHERVPEPRTGDEVAHLARTMNAMLDRLEGSAKRQHRFVSDASHELRSPVTSIRTEVEVAMAHPDRTDWDQVGRNVLAEDARLEGIVTDLLTLARLDERARSTAVEVDLDDVVQAEARRTRRLTVSTDRVEPVRVLGREADLGRMVGHLLDNATRHAVSRVDVSLTRTASGEARMVVDDDGPGVPVEQREVIFERFGRLEEARTRDGGGAGLGLAVVKGIVDAHGGHVVVGDSPSGGARFEVTVPITSP